MHKFALFRICTSSLSKDIEFRSYVCVQSCYLSTKPASVVHARRTSTSFRSGTYKRSIAIAHNA